MKKNKKKNIIEYAKPSKLIPFAETIDVIKANIKKFDEKLFHLQNKMDFTQSMSRGVNDSPAFQKLVEKKLNLKEKRRLESEYVLKTINSIITTFKDIQVSDSNDVADIKNCIAAVLANTNSEVDKGAILSNIFTLHVDEAVKEDFYKEIEHFIAKDRELLTGFLMHSPYNEENRKLAYSIIEPAGAIEDLFKNSLKLRVKDKKSAVVSDIILGDKAYLDKLFIKLGDNAKNIQKIKELSSNEKKLVKKQYAKYRVETNTKPKLGTGLLTYTAKLPGAVSKVLKGTFSAVGSVFQMINWTFIGMGVIISAPFDLIKMGLDGINTSINKNRTYKEDMKDIYRDVTKALKRSGQKFKYIEDIKINIDDNGSLAIGCVLNKKHHIQELYEVKYNLSEGELKNFKNIMKEYFADKENGNINDFEVGQMRKKKDIIRFMRRIAEVTKDEKNVSEVNYKSSFDESIQEIEISSNEQLNKSVVPMPAYSYTDEKEEE